MDLKDPREEISFRRFLGQNAPSGIKKCSNHLQFLPFSCSDLYRYLVWRSDSIRVFNDANLAGKKPRIVKFEPRFLNFLNVA